MGKHPFHIDNNWAITVAGPGYGVTPVPVLRVNNVTIDQPPGGGIYLDSSAAYFARKEPDKITATASYSDRSGQQFSSTMLHDLAIYRDIAFIPKSERTSPTHGHSS